MRFYIYQLRASDEHQPFYIGKSFEGSKRLVEHLHVARKTRRMTSSKIQSVLKRNAAVMQEILFWFDTEAEAHDKEVELICLYGRKDKGTGFLTNHTDGGGGVVGWVASTETRKKMSLAKMGNKINVGRKRPDFAAMWTKPITMFAEDGTVLKHYQSSKECVDETGLHKAVISDCLRGRIKTSKTDDGNVYRFAYGTATKPLPPLKRKQHAGLGKVQQFTKEGILIAIFRNSKEAEEVTKIAGPSVRNCIHGKAKTAGGYIWKLAV